MNTSPFKQFEREGSWKKMAQRSLPVDISALPFPYIAWKGGFTDWPVYCLTRVIDDCWLESWEAEIDKLPTIRVPSASVSTMVPGYHIQNNFCYIVIKILAWSPCQLSSFFYEIVHLPSERPGHSQYEAWAAVCHIPATPYKQAMKKHTLNRNFS